MSDNNNTNFEDELRALMAPDSTCWPSSRSTTPTSPSNDFRISVGSVLAKTRRDEGKVITARRSP
jgi:hypothetical protein